MSTFDIIMKFLHLIKFDTEIFAAYSGSCLLILKLWGLQQIEIVQTFQKQVLLKMK